MSVLDFFVYCVAAVLALIFAAEGSRASSDAEEK